MFSFTMGDYTFEANSAQELATLMHELADQPIEDTLKLCRELKKDSPHVIMENGCIFTVEKHR